MHRFNVENGKMITNKDGEYTMLFTHENVIDRLHEHFDLKEVTFPKPEMLCIAKTGNTYSVMKFSDLKNKEDNINNLFIKITEHNTILQQIEQQIFA